MRKNKKFRGEKGGVGQNKVKETIYKCRMDLKSMKNKIFENYFKKNRHLIPEQMFELETDSELDEKIALEVESELEKLPDGHPAKNSQGAKSFFDLVKKGLEDPDIVEDAIASIVSDISTKMT